MNVAIMQPYIFPYVGYFQLIKAVDEFVFYDDVQFIKKGWINRNQLLINDKAHLFSVPLNKPSQNKLVNEIKLALDQKWLNHFYSTLEFNYKKAPFYKEIFPLIQSVFKENHTTISDLAIDSVKKFANHLNISTHFELSSEKYPQTKGMKKANRLIEICSIKKTKNYINPYGGKDLYDKKYFKKHNINLFFIDNVISSYHQYNNSFVGGLSMIDVLMFNHKQNVKQMLNEFKLI